MSSFIDLDDMGADRVEPIYTPEEVAAIFRVTADTIRVLLNAGELRGFKIGKMWRITHTELQRYTRVRFKIKTKDETGYIT